MRLEEVILRALMGAELRRPDADEHAKGKCGCLTCHLADKVATGRLDMTERQIKRLTIANRTSPNLANAAKTLAEADEGIFDDLKAVAREEGYPEYAKLVEIVDEFRKKLRDQWNPMVNEADAKTEALKKVNQPGMTQKPPPEKGPFDS